MTKISSINDHGSALAWSPAKDNADVVALGTKVSESAIQKFELSSRFMVVPTTIGIGTSIIISPKMRTFFVSRTSLDRARAWKRNRRILAA
jgi:hypothetical protein